MNSQQRARQMLLISEHFLPKDTLSVTLAHPITLDVYQGNELKHIEVVRVARNKVEARPRFFTADNKPVEIAHCAPTVADIVSRYHQEQVEAKAQRELKEALEALKATGITDIQEFAYEHGFSKANDFPKEILTKWTAYLNGEIGARPAQELKSFIDNVLHCEEVVIELSARPFEELATSEKKSLLYAKRCLNDKDALYHYTLWRDAIRYDQEVPVLNDIWHSEMDRLLRIFEEYGYQKLIYMNKSTAACEDIAALVKAGYNKIEATVLRAVDDMFPRDEVALILSK